MTICVTDFTKRDPRSRFEKKLAAYALAGGAILVMPGAASASIIQVTPGTPISLSVGSGEGDTSVDVDMDGDGNVDFVFGAHSLLNGSYFNNWVDVDGGKTNAVVKGYQGSYSTYAKAYPAPGTIPDSGANFTSKATLMFVSAGDSLYLYGEWQNDLTQPSFLGVRFVRNGVDTYGWINVATQFGSADLQINSWAFDDATATVPEPSSMALLAAGAAGVIALRRRRKTQ